MVDHGCQALFHPRLALLNIIGPLGRSLRPFCLYYLALVLEPRYDLGDQEGHEHGDIQNHDTS